MQRAPAAGAGESSGDVQQAVAQPLGRQPCAACLQDAAAQPGEQVLGEQDELEPGLVGIEGVEGQAREAEFACFGDAILDAGMQAVADLQGVEVVAALVGQKAL